MISEIFETLLLLDCVIRMKLEIPLFQSEFDAQQLLVNKLGKIPPIGDFGYFWWLLWLTNLIFRHDFEIGHLVVILAYYPIAKNRKSRFGQAHAQNRAHISSVYPRSKVPISKVPWI